MNRDVAVLLCVYVADKQCWFERAIDSLVRQDYDKGRIKIYLCIDGELAPAMEHYITDNTSTFYFVHRNTKNLGIAASLNALIDHLEDEPFVARMDADDINFPNRIREQVAYLDAHPDVHLVGTEVIEIDASDKPLYHKRFPEHHDEIVELFQKMDPFIHPTVMFRRQVLRSVGRYAEDCPFAEDTMMWAQVISSGFQVANIQTPLLCFRADTNLYSRRRGLKYSVGIFVTRMKVNRRMNYGMFSNGIALIGLFFHTLPTPMVKMIYNKLDTKKEYTGALEANPEIPESDIGPQNEPPLSPRTPLFSIEQCESFSIAQISDLYKKYVNPGQVQLIGSFGFGRECVEEAEGQYIYTKSGKKILDFTGGIGVLNHGHNHPRILAVRRRFQEHKKMEVHKNFFSPYIAGLSRNIISLLPEELQYCYFPNSGAESVEGAIKMAYKFHAGQRNTILHSDISFHGKLLGAASITHSPEVKFKFPEIPNARSFQYNDITSIRQAIEQSRKSNGTSDIYAIVLEPMNASLVVECDGQFLKELRSLCDRENIVLIFDEVYTGWAKTGSLFYFMRHGVTPDILTMAKSLGGGKATIAGYVARKEVFMKAYGNLDDSIIHSTTYNGFGEETATAIEAVNIVVEDDYPARARKIYSSIHPQLIRLQQQFPKIIKEVRGCGALLGIVINSDLPLIDTLASWVPSKMFKDERFMQKVVTGAVISNLFEEHNILTFFGSNKEIVLIVSPMLVATEDDITWFISGLEQTLKKGLFKLCLKFVKQKFFKGAVPKNG